jgi:hypothetical protein
MKFLLLLSLVLFPVVAPAASEPPGGVVMALSGSTTPQLATMEEIPSGTAVQLSAGAELTFLHYAKCKLVTVFGGSLTVTRTEFTTDGKIVREKDGPCPRVHQLSGENSGLVLRGNTKVPRWPLNRELVFVGAGANKLRGVAIYSDGGLDAPLVRLDVSGHRASFPANAVALVANERYVLRLTMANQPDTVDITFVGVAPDGRDLLIVLR